MNAIRSLMMSAIDRDHGAILFSTANPADEVFGSHKCLNGLARGGRLTQFVVHDFQHVSVRIMKVYRVGILF